MLSIFTDSKPFKSSQKLSKLLHALKHLLNLGQNIRLLSVPFPGLHDSSSLSKLWKILACSSIDTIFSDQGQLSIFALLILIFISLLILCILCQVLLVVAGKLPSSLIKSFTCILILAVCDFFYIPCCVLLLCIIKYLNNPEKIMHEYLEKNKIKNIIFGMSNSHLVMAVVVVALGFLVVLNIVFETFYYEIRHSVAKYNINSKHFPEVDALEKISIFVCSMLYVFLNENYYVIQVIIQVIIYGIVVVGYLKYLPYYSQFINYLKVILNFECFCLSCFFLIGISLNNAIVPFILFIFLQPCIFLIVKSLVERRCCYIKSLNVEIYDSKVLFELFHREQLKKQQIISDFFKKSRKNYERTKNKLIYVLESNYAETVLNNPMLGLIKILRAPYKGADLLKKLQIYITKKRLEQLCYNNSEGYDIVLFLKEFKEALNKEGKYFNEFQLLWIQMYQYNLNIDKLKDTINKLSNLICSIKKHYSNILKSFPQSQLVNQMYGSFLCNIISQEEQGKKYLMKAQTHYNLHETTNKKRTIFSNLNGCIMVLSGKASKIGKIVYASNQTCEFLKISYSESRHHYIKDFIPKPFSIDHDNKMLRFLDSSEKTNYYINFPLFIQNKENFLCECEISMECVGFNSKIYFVAVLEPIEINRAIVLFDRYGVIYGHSKNLSEIISSNVLRFTEKNIFDIFQGLTIENITSEEFHRIEIYSEKNKSFIQLGLYVKEKWISDTQLLVLYITNDIKEIAKFSSTGKKRPCIEKSAKDITIKEISNPSKTVHFEKTESKIPQPVFSIYSKNTEADATHNMENIKTTPKSQKISYETTKAIKYIKYIKILLIVSVIAIIASNVMILTYITDQVSHSNSLEALDHIGYYNYYTTYLIMIIRSVKLAMNWQVPSFYTVEDIKVVIDKLKDVNHDISEDCNKWTYCPSHKIFTELELAVWGNLTIKSITYENLVNVIMKTSRKFEVIYEKIVGNDTDWENDEFFLVYNILRINVNELYDAHTGFAQCEAKKVESVNYIVYYLFFGGLLLIGLVTVVFLFFICWIENSINYLWKALHKKLKHNFSNINSRIQHRISHFHDQHENTQFEPIQSQPYHFHKPKHSIYYIYKLLPFLALPLILYLITILIFHKNLQDYLMYRIQFNDPMFDLKILLAKLAYFTIESVAAKSNYPIIQDFEGLDLFSPPSTLAISANNKLSETRKLFFYSDFKRILTNDAWEIVYGKNYENDNFLKCGILSGFMHMRFEANELIFGKEENYIELVGGFIKDLKVFHKMLNETAELIDSNSNSIIYRELYKLLVFSITSIIVLTLLTIFHYYPYFTKEQEFLKKLECYVDALSENPNYYEAK